MRKLTLLFLFSSLAAAFPIEWTPAFEGFGVGGFNGARSTLANPGNSILRVPDWTAGVDLRPSLDARYGESWRAIFRPRYLGNVNGVTVNAVRSTDTFSRLQVDEGYLRWEASGSFNLTGGILNFQWGPAELLSPSNPIIHFHADERSLLYRPRGKVLARAVYSFSADTTAVLLVEPLNNGEELFIAGHDFTPRALLKLEKRFRNAANYVGLTGGREDQGQGFVGEYFAAYLNDSFSVYGDARETLGSPAYYLSGGTLAQTRIDDKSIYALATAGLRYEGAVDARVEYIYNGYGLSKSELTATTALLYTNPSAIPLARQAGRELNQQHYLYASIRYDKLGTGDSLRLAARYLFSPADSSGSLLATLEWACTDNLTLLAQPVVYHGSPTSEFGQAPTYEFLGGVRAAF